MAGRKFYNSNYRTWRYRNNRRRYYRIFYRRTYAKKLANRKGPNYLSCKITFHKMVQMGSNFTYYFTEPDNNGTNPQSTLWVSEMVENDEVFKMYNAVFDLVRIKGLSVNFNPGINNNNPQMIIPFQVRYIYNEDKFDANTNQVVLPFNNHLGKYYKVFTSKYLPSGQTNDNRLNGDGLPGRLSVADTNQGANRTISQMPKWNLTITVYLIFKKNCLFN